jgi:hypothetical protein
MIGFTSGPVFVTLEVNVLAIVCGLGKDADTRGDGGLTVEGESVEDDPVEDGPVEGGPVEDNPVEGDPVGDDGRPLSEDFGTSADSCGSEPVGFSHWTLPDFAC